MAALQYKDDHNRIAYLGRERGSEDFTDILSYLDHSPLRYALTHDPPVVFDSLVKQFWATATVRPNAAGSHDLVAAIDGREGEAIPLTPPMLAIAAAGNDAADEDNVLAHADAGSPAVAHPVPHPPPFSPVREPTPERLPETEWVVPIPVSPITDWRPWPSVPAPSPIRDPTPEPASPPTRRTDSAPANYIEPEDITHLNSMEDETILGGFHEETHAGPDDAPTPTADAAGRAEDPALLTSLSAKIDSVMGG
ncbi:hypothetical protein Tco_0083870 [Tanacetum coccineum]